MGEYRLIVSSSITRTKYVLADVLICLCSLNQHLQKEMYNYDCQLEDFYTKDPVNTFDD